MKEEILTAKEWLEKEDPEFLGDLMDRSYNIIEKYVEYKKQELIDTYDEYIKLLSSELDKLSGLQITHPHLVEVYTENSEVVVKGKNLREKINKLKANNNGKQ